MSGYIATPLATTYAASKVYDLFLAEGLGYELSKDGVDVTYWRFAPAQRQLNSTKSQGCNLLRRWRFSLSSNQP